MKRSLLIALLVTSVIRSSGQVPAVPISPRPLDATAGTNSADPAADREHDALWAAWNAKPPAGLTRTNRAFWEWQDKVQQKFAADAQAYAQKYPNDPRRWEAIVQSGYTRPWFITGFKPDFDAHQIDTNLIVDEVALAAFNARQMELDRSVVLAGDSTTRQRGGALNWMLVTSGIAARKEAKELDLRQFEPLMDEVAAKLPDERGATVLAIFLDVLHSAAPDLAPGFEAKFADKPIGQAMKELAARQEQARAEEQEKLRQATVDIGTMKFTAADGRPVDVAALRGKVVLIDFWATWCAPCIREIPNVVANYQKYHERGFEVISISLENSDLAADDPPEVKDRKIAAAKEKMLAFAQKNNMVWPQYFDGLYWKNEFAVKYGIHLIPAMFLLEKDGKVASIEARGPVLETEIKRLLGI